MAIGYSALALLIYLIGGSETFERNDVTLLSVLLSYWCGAIGSGLLLGLLRPLTASKISAMFVGPIIAAPAVTSLGVTINGMPWQWPAEAVATLMIVSVIFGVYGGYVFGGRHSNE
jgi:hypothetical protein